MDFTRPGKNLATPGPDPGQRGDELRAKNRTLEFTQWLVTQLVGFKFVTLDSINRN